MFQWIVFARRPLRSSELREAIAFTIEDRQRDSSKIPNNLQRLVRACGNLILIDEDTDNVQLAHYSVQQYLLDQHRPSFSGLRISKEEADAKLGEVCLAYLGFSDFETQVTMHTDTVTPSMAALEDIITTQSLLPLDSPAMPAVKVLRKIRGPSPLSTKIAFARHLPERDLLKRDPELNFKEKYKLLSYIIDNWLWHTMDFEEIQTTMREKFAFSTNWYCRRTYPSLSDLGMRPNPRAKRTSNISSSPLWAGPYQIATFNCCRLFSCVMTARRFKFASEKLSVGSFLLQVII
jgi:hypothetical protein